ncbi:hypothetical protein MAR_010764 [Mya arenaria]|uniref:Uncharacterized protein n=1 Tax=Mya arenaria TaxID=6604 RepID=A0ABY7FS52_MYAAR|nr:hypothetical protein MAR_010764 [Mya arenaria]
MTVVGRKYMSTFCTPSVNSLLKSKRTTTPRRPSLTLPTLVSTVIIGVYVRSRDRGHARATLPCHEQ